MGGTEGDGADRASESRSTRTAKVNALKQRVLRVAIAGVLLSIDS